MTARSRTSMTFVAVSVLALSLSVGCGIINPPSISGADPVTVSSSSEAPAGQPASAAPATDAAAAPAAATGPRSVVVKKDAIVEKLALDGIVTVQEEVPISFPGHGKVEDVKVKPGQAVSEGDVLLQLDGVDLSRSLDAARARYQTSQANLAQSVAQLAASQRTAQQRAAAAAVQQQQAVADAENGLRKAQDNLTVVMAGASDLERHTAENNLAAAQGVMQKALAAQDRLTAPPDPAMVRSAQSEVGNAQVVVNKARADLDALTRSPDPIALSAAQRELDRSRTQLQLAQIARIDPKAPDQNAAKLAHDSAVADATLAVQVADDRLAKMQQPASDVDVQAAKQRVQNAEDALSSAQGKFAALRQEPDQSALDGSQMAVDAAQRGIDDAQSRLDTLDSRPTRAELADAQDQVRRAQSALNAARSPSGQGSADPGGVDLTSLQEAVNQDQATVASLEQLLQNTNLTSPMTGTVVSVRVKPGDTITSARPVFTMAKPGAPVVRIQLADDQAGRMAPGQQATIDLGTNSSVSTPPISATVASVAATADGTGSVATIRADWRDGSVPKVGLPVQVSVVVQQKSSVLVVPKNAVRQAGGKTYVEVLNGSLRKIINIQVGITSTDSFEVVSGLTEGQQVLLHS